jgi:3-hydroxy acid dehydrogenase/malonic semialdehyde reductase
MRILITGATSGIGKSCAYLFASQGHDLILMARRYEKLQELQNELSSKYSGQKFEVFEIDLRKKESIDHFFSSYHGLSHIDVLINNAGLAKGVESVDKSSFADWQDMIDTNITGLFYLTHQLVPFFVKKLSGHIINLGSVAGRWTYPGGAVYCATKAAVKSFTEGLRLDLMGKKIRVTNISPGMVETEFSKVRFNDHQKAQNLYQNMTPLTGEDIANTISWVIGQPLHVNIQELVIYPTDQAGVGHVHRHE